MRPVNLLPAQSRPRALTSSGGRGSYAVLGALSVVLLLVLAYVVTSNQVSSRKTEIARTKQEVRIVQERSQALAPYATFSQAKEARLASVKSLAAVRLDWERLMREIALVLPSGTWLTDVNASLAGDSSTGAAASGAAAPPTGGAAAGPSVAIEGCAKRAPDVAVLLVRLRKLHGASDVKLSDATKPASSGGGAAPVGGSTSVGGTPDTCTGYEFKVAVAMSLEDATQERGDGRVPAALGGGS